MMYLPTLDLWGPGIQRAILSNQIKLQRGQWLRCGESGKRCRYVGHTKRSINVVHWQGSPGATRARFHSRVMSNNLAQLHTDDKTAWRAVMAFRKTYTRRTA